jgi:hypothetical protein
VCAAIAIYAGKVSGGVVHYNDFSFAGVGGQLLLYKAYLPVGKTGAFGVGRDEV